MGIKWKDLTLRTQYTLQKQKSKLDRRCKLLLKSSYLIKTKDFVNLESWFKHEWGTRVWIMAQVKISNRVEASHHSSSI